MQKFHTMFDSLDSWPTIAIIHRIPLLILDSWIFDFVRRELDIQLQNELDRNFCKMSMFTSNRHSSSLEINLTVYINIRSFSLRVYLKLTHS